jgi:hypothetical protein
MAVTTIPSELGPVCGVVIRARTLSQGIYDIVVGQRGVVLVPLWGPGLPRPAAMLLGGFQGGAIGHHRGGENDVRRREGYLATTADDLARRYFSNRTIRRQDVVRAHVWDHRGSGKLRLELSDGTNYTLRWEKRANKDVDAAALLVTALGPAVEVRQS